MSYTPPPYSPGPQYPQQPGQPYGAPPPGYPLQPPPPPQKPARPGRVILITAAAVVAVCVGGMAVAVVAGGNGPSEPTTVTEAAQQAKDTGSAEDDDQATTDTKADDKGPFDLKLGAEATVETGDGTQTIVVKSVRSFKKGCSGFAPQPDNGMYVVADVVIEATEGEVSVNALNFTWVATDGTTSDSLDGLFSGCDKNHLDAADIRTCSPQPRRPGGSDNSQNVFGCSSARLISRLAR